MNAWPEIIVLPPKDDILDGQPPADKPPSVVNSNRESRQAGEWALLDIESDLIDREVSRGTSEERLWLAVMKLGMIDAAQSPEVCRGKDRLRYRAEALEWLSSDATHRTNSFRSLCDYFGLSAEYLRERVAAAARGKSPLRKGRLT